MRYTTLTQILKSFIFHYKYTAALNPRAQIKNRTKYSKDTFVILFKNLLDALKAVLKNKLPEVRMVSFTTDFWSSAGANNYSLLMMHYISPC